LLAAVQYASVITYVRRSTGRAHPKLSEHVVDFDSLRSAPPASGADVFCCLGTTIKNAGSESAFAKVDAGYVGKLARFARDHGSRQFLLVSSVGANRSSSNFYLRTKGTAEALACEAGYESVHVFRPSVLVGTREESRPWEAVSMAVLTRVRWAMPGALRRYRAIAASTVADAMLAAAFSDARGVQVHEHDAIVRLATAR
jgi:uncharacterized protein YbjT (DUF2867 family)